MQTARNDNGNDTSMGTLGSLQVVPAAEFAGWNKAVSFATRRPLSDAANSHTAAVPASGATDSRLDEAELRFLRTVVNHPGEPSSVLPKLARVSTRRAQQIRERLVQLGYLKVHRVNTSGRGRASIVLEALPLAHEALAGRPPRAKGEL